MIPVNAPKCPARNNHHDGFMNFAARDEEVNYFPSRFDPVRHAAPHPIARDVVAGRRERAIIAKENNFKQPGERFRAMPRDRQDRFIGRMADILADKRCTAEIRRIWIGYWSQADAGLGQRLAQKLQAAGAM